MDERTIQLIEQAVFTPELWPQALEEMGRAHDAQILSLIRQGPLGLELLAAPHAEDARAAYVREGWFEHDIRTQVGVNVSSQFTFMTDELFVRPEEKGKALFYRDFATRFDVPHCLAWRFTHNEDTYVWTFMRPESAGPATALDKAKLKPWMARASAAAILASKVAQTRVAGLLDGLDASNTAALALGANGKVIGATAAAERLFCSDFDVHNGVLAIGDGSVAAALRALRHALAPGRRDGDMPGFAFMTEAGKILALPMRLGTPALDFFADVRAMLVLKPLRPSPPCNPTILQIGYSLTAGEADVASWLGAGLTVEEIAQARHVQPATVRHMLKTVLQKMGLRRQAEIAAVVSALAR